MLDRRAILAGAALAPLALPAAADTIGDRHAPLTNPDAPIIDAFHRWAALSWRMEGAGLSDEAADALLDDTNAAARVLFTLPAATMEGFALQTFVHLHGVYGGTRRDPIAPDWPKPDEHVPEADMLRPLYERVMEASAAVRAPWMAGADGRPSDRDTA